MILLDLAVATQERFYWLAGCRISLCTLVLLGGFWLLVSGCGATWVQGGGWLQAKGGRVTGW